MNYQWMIQRITAFRITCNLVNNAMTSPLGSSGVWFVPKASIITKYRGELPTFLKIVKALEVALPSRVPSDLAKQSEMYMTLADVAVGVARDWEVVKVNLAPDAPSVGADHFHPRVWGAAEPLWDTGQYRVAVGAAATSLSAHIAQKAGSDQADRALVTDVFSLKTAPDRPRLHFPGEPNSHWRSRQEGLHLTAQGAFAGIRNVAAHSYEEWTEQQALEMLAVLSLVARWTDETELRTAPPPPRQQAAAQQRPVVSDGQLEADEHLVAQLDGELPIR
jgi:hypothetical protein